MTGTELFAEYKATVHVRTESPHGEYLYSFYKCDGEVQLQERRRSSFGRRFDDLTVDQIVTDSVQEFLRRRGYSVAGDGQAFTPGDVGRSDGGEP